MTVPSVEPVLPARPPDFRMLFEAAPDPYLESLRKLHHIIERVNVQKMFADGDDVCLLYDMVTNTPAGTAFIAEWHQVRKGKIRAIRVVFDARPFAAMFAKS